MEFFGYIVDPLFLLAIPAIFYLYDNIMLIEERCLLMYESPGFQWDVLFSEIPFTIRHRHLHFLNPGSPYTLVFKLSWMKNSEFGKDHINSTYRRIELWRENAFPLRVVAVAEFVLLFISAPYLTWLAGLSAAFLIVLPSYIFIICVAGFIIFDNLELFEMSTSGLVAMLLEFLICPGYLPNVCRRVSLKLSALEADGAALFLERGQGYRVHEFQRKLRLRLEEMTDIQDDYATRLGL